jgi:hypothetical protein
MFKKILLVFIVLSPLWYSLLIGFPVVSEKDYHIRVKSSPYIVSRRCFGVGDFNQFITCFPQSAKLNGVDFITTVTSKTNQISPLFTIGLCICFMLFILLSIIIILV